MSATDGQPQSPIRTTPRRATAHASLFTVATVALLLMATGCQVDERKEIGFYRSILDGPTPQHVDYRAGQPLSLPEALLLANQNNERLAIGGEDYVQALIDKERAASAFFPTISLVPSYSKADAASDAGNLRVNGTGNSGGTGNTGGTGGNNGGTGTASGSSGGAVDQNSLLGSPLATGKGALDTPVNLNVNLFRGFRDVANLARVKAQIRRTRSLLLDLQAAVLLDVARSYYQVLRLEAAAQVLENSAAVQDARVREIRARDIVGSASKLDVAQTEAQAAATRASLIAARSDARSARALLAFLVDAPVADARLVDELYLPKLTQPVETFIALAGERRQDLRAAEAAVEAARQNVQIAFGEYYPSISLNINYYLSRQSAPDGSEWNALLSLSQPLFTGGRINADHRTALSQLRQAKSQQRLVWLQIVQDTFLAYQNVDTSGRRLGELQVEVAAAQQALDVAEARYRTGGGTYLDELIAQDRLLSAQLDLANELFNRKLQYLNLLRTVGQLYRPPTSRELAPETVAPVPGVPRPATAPAGGPIPTSLPAVAPSEGGAAGAAPGGPPPAQPVMNSPTTTTTTTTSPTGARP